jgi:CubicO group peptidase (beta-lactamase class C family)
MQYFRFRARWLRAAATTATLLMSAAGWPTLALGAPVDAARIDALFSAFTDQTPGCAAAVARDGRTVYARGFGLADLSHRVPIGPDTVFEISSVSKQFTALAVLLLEADGKLKLDDTLQQHLPELAPVVSQPVSLRQLLQHTGGLGGYTEVLELAGVHHENVVGAPEALRALAVLPQPNSRPGTRFMYSDTGYFLLAQVVARVSGGSLDALLQARVFGPLGMTSTLVYDDPRRVVPRRARAYAPGKGPQIWKLQESHWHMDGDAGVQSSVNDLARWGAEVTRPKVLPPGLVEALRTPGRLSDGTPIPYGLGQVIGNHRGLPFAEHAGEWVGYRARLIHYPTQDTSVAVACNAAQASARALAQGVADIVLADAFAPDAAPAAAEGVPDAPRYRGQYLHEGGFEAARISGDAGALTVQLGSRRAGLVAAADGSLRTRAGALFTLSEGGQLLKVSEGGRPPESYRRLPPFTPTAADDAALAGLFRQGQMGGTLTVTQAADGPRVQFNAPVGEVAPLQWLGPDHLVGPRVLLRVERDAQRRVVALVYLHDRVRGLRYPRER